VSVPAGGQGVGVAVCPTGEIVVGGGFFSTTSGLSAHASFPGGAANEWVVYVDNTTPSVASFHATAICLSNVTQ
jgi:hypothetical protein